MDIFSHGLWGGLCFGRHAGYGTAFLCGMLPDLLAFGPYTLYRLASRQLYWQHGTPPTAENFPAWVHFIYNCTHSLLISGLIFAALWLYSRPLALAFLAWPLHILLDIPTHSSNFFPTRFLFPLSDVHVNGIVWHNRYIWGANALALLVAYLVVWVRRGA